MRALGEMLRVERMLEIIEVLDFLEVLGVLALYSHFFCVCVLV